MLQTLFVVYGLRCSMLYRMRWLANPPIWQVWSLDHLHGQAETASKPHCCTELISCPFTPTCSRLKSTAPCAPLSPQFRLTSISFPCILQEYRLDKSGQLLPPPLKREPRPSSPSHPSSPSSPRQTTLDSFLDLSPEKAVKRERGKAKGRTGRLQGAFGGSKPRAQ